MTTKTAKKPTAPAGLRNIEDILSVPEFVKMGVTRTRLNRWTRTGEFPKPRRFINQKSEPLWPLSDLLSWAHEKFHDCPAELASIEGAFLSKAAAKK